MRWSEAYFRMQTIGMWIDWVFGALCLLAVIGIIIYACWPSKGDKKK